MSQTIWYQIDSDKFGQCHQPMVFCSQVPEGIAERVAADFEQEIRYITGLGAEVKAWVE